MAKIIVVFLCIAIAANILVPTQASPAPGALVPNLVTNLVLSLTCPVNKLICYLLGPDFLRVFLGSCHCPNGVIIPSDFTCIEDFCKWWFCATPAQKQCISDAAVALNIQLPGLLDLQAGIAHCCQCFV